MIEDSTEEFLMASSEEGSFGLPVGTLRTRYPRVQASSQDNGSGSRLPAGGSSEATTCPRSSGSCPSAWGSSGAATCPCDSGSHLPARGSSGPTVCHPGPSTHLLAQCHTRFLRPKPDAHRMYAQDQVVIHTVRM
jgi:hypothetical protein